MTPSQLLSYMSNKHSRYQQKTNHLKSVSWIKQENYAFVTLRNFQQTAPRRAHAQSSRFSLRANLFFLLTLDKKPGPVGRWKNKENNVCWEATKSEKILEYDRWWLQCIVSWSTSSCASAKYVNIYDKAKSFRLGKSYINNKNETRSILVCFSFCCIIF